MFLYDVNMEINKRKVKKLNLLDVRDLKSRGWITFVWVRIPLSAQTNHTETP